MVSSDFLNQLDKLMMFSDEPCLCEGVGQCRRCAATEELENLYSKIAEAVDRIQSISQSVS